MTVDIMAARGCDGMIFGLVQVSCSVLLRNMIELHVPLWDSRVSFVMLRHLLTFRSAGLGKAGHPQDVCCRQ